MRKIAYIAVFAAVICVFNPAFGGEAKEAWRKPRGEGIFKELNLSPEQQQKLKDNRNAHKEKMKQIISALKEQHKKLTAEMAKAQVTRQSLEPIAQEIKSLQAQLVDLRIENMLALKAILTPEQYQKFNELVSKRREKIMSQRRKGKDAWMRSF